MVVAMADTTMDITNPAATFDTRLFIVNSFIKHYFTKAISNTSSYTPEAFLNDLLNLLILFVM
jgi:hypothetical protein